MQGGKDGGKDGGKSGKDGGKDGGKGKGKKGGRDSKGFGKGGRKGSGDAGTVDMSKQECKNDYSQHYVNCGERPQNSVRETGMVRAEHLHLRMFCDTAALCCNTLYCV